MHYVGVLPVHACIYEYMGSIMYSYMYQYSLYSFV